MTQYDDAKSYRNPLTIEEAAEIIGNLELNITGYDEETNSYGPVSSRGDEMVDPGLRYTFTPYNNLGGPIANKSKRVAAVEVTHSGNELSMRVGGIFVNVGRKRDVFVHWPSSQFGNVNNFELAYEGERIALIPYIIHSFGMWLNENDDAAPVVEWMREFTKGEGD